MKIFYSLLALLVLTLIGLSCWMWGPQVLHGVGAFLRILWPFIIVVAIAVVIAAALPELSIIPIGVGILIFVGMLFAGDWVRASTYADTIEVADSASIPSYDERVPFEVAAAVSQRNLGSTNGDATGIVKAIPAKGQFTSSVVRRGMFQGYESTQVMELPTYGSASSSDITFCEFSDDATLRFGGAVPSNNLTRAIYTKTSPSVRVERGDAFIACENGVPTVYAPLTKLKGAFFPIRVPAGVAIYDGSTGELSIEESYEGDYPVYPSSVATAQREATQAAGSWTDYIFKRVGFEDTSKDAEDPNGANSSGFSLAADGTSRYVTPLTPRGDSKSITALGDIRSDVVVSGELNPYTVHTYPSGESRPANSSIAARITSEVLDGYKATGLSVFEIVPAADGAWTASIGKSQSILYRATIHPDGTIELFDADGDLVKEGNVDEEIDSEPSAPVPADSDLDSLTDAELTELGKAILDELGSRE